MYQQIDDESVPYMERISRRDEHSTEHNQESKTIQDSNLLAPTYPSIIGENPVGKEQVI